MLIGGNLLRLSYRPYICLVYLRKRRIDGKLIEMFKMKQAESEGLSSPLGALRQSIFTHPKTVRCVAQLHDCASHDSMHAMIMVDNNNTTTPTQEIVAPSASISTLLCTGSFAHTNHTTRSDG